MASWTSWCLLLVFEVRKCEVRVLGVVKGWKWCRSPDLDGSGSSLVSAWVRLT